MKFRFGQSLMRPPPKNDPRAFALTTTEVLRQAEFKRAAAHDTKYLTEHMCVGPGTMGPAKGYVAMKLMGSSEGFISLLTDGDRAQPFYAYLTKEAALSLAQQLVQAAAEAQQVEETEE